MSEMIVKGVETAEEQEVANDLMAKVHYPGYYAALAHMNRFLGSHPEYRREHTRLVVLEGQIISCLCIFTHTIRLGEARMKMGGIGNVATAGPWRGKGYAAILMGDAMRYMKSHGYHVSTLFGIADFYHRWGFASVLPEYASMIDVKEAHKANGKVCKHRQIKPGDVAAVRRIHDRNDSDIACSVVRYSGHFTSRWDRWKQARVINNAQGKVVAYFLGNAAEGEYQVDELGASDRSWFAPLLSACVAEARNEYAARIRFNVPPAHPFIKFLMQYRADHEMRTYRNSNGMMAFVDIEEALECMVAEWESLLSLSVMANLAATVTFVIDRVPFRVRSHHGAIDVTPGAGDNKVSLTSAEFVQLVTGYRHLEDIFAAKRIAVNASAHAFMRILFPKRIPYVWLTDRF